MPRPRIIARHISAHRGSKEFGQLCTLLASIPLQLSRVETHTNISYYYLIIVLMIIQYGGGGWLLLKKNNVTTIIYRTRNCCIPCHTTFTSPILAISSIKVRLTPVGVLSVMVGSKGNGSNNMASIHYIKYKKVTDRRRTAKPDSNQPRPQILF